VNIGETGMKTKHGLFSGLRLVSVGLIAAALLVPSTASSQDVAVGQATATVLTVLSVTATSPLAFGDVYQGVPKTIAKNTATAGEFTITGEADANIAVYMQLPDYLATDAASGSGDDRMVIAFSTTDCNIDTTGAGDPTGFVAVDGWIDQDPHNVTSATTVGSAGTNIYLGGTVQPSVDQKAGDYEADIVLTVAYTGT
jgi:hypothetical protein